MKKQLKDYFRLNAIQLAKARDVKARMIFPDPISGALYLKTLAQAQNAFTLLEMVVGECDDKLREKIFEVLTMAGAIKKEKDLDNVDM